jgi:serine/threonine protein kinase
MLSTVSTDDAAIKIVDFGCAHLVTTDPNDHKHRGTANTPSYCPPEILSIKHGDPEGSKHGKILPSFDMWSLGVILYGASRYNIHARRR